MVSAGGDIVYLGEIRALEHGDFVASASFTSDGKYLVTLGLNRNTIYVWDANAGEEILRHHLTYNRCNHTE